MNTYENKYFFSFLCLIKSLISKTSQLIKKIIHSRCDLKIRFIIKRILIDLFNFSIEGEFTNCLIPFINTPPNKLFKIISTLKTHLKNGEGMWCSDLSSLCLWIKFHRPCLCTLFKHRVRRSKV